MRFKRVPAVLLAVALFAGACSGSSTPDNVAAIPYEGTPAPTGEVIDFGPAPESPTGPYSQEVQLAVETAFGANLAAGIWQGEQVAALETIAKSGDVRVGWLISDLLRLAQADDLRFNLGLRGSELLGFDFNSVNPWREMTERLIAWDIPEPPGYVEAKARIYTLLVTEWEDLIVEGSIDWRHVSWGGVRIDDRAYNTTDEPCNCIPAADNPEVTAAADADWLDDDDIIFGLEINGEARAYPRQIMEVREMVNDTLGGRDLGIPYCTLCGSAQAYFTDEVPDGVDRPILRTSGLLIRSNKVMYDLESRSVFDTFLGTAVTGPLADQGIVLPQAGLVSSTWADWVADHPDTTVLIEDLALGRNPDFRNNRDADGPIFPIGTVDPRLPVQEDVLGIVTESGTPVAFHVASAVEHLTAGNELAVENVRVILDGSGVRAVDADGNDLGGHQAFWFAWSQFHPGTDLWPTVS